MPRQLAALIAGSTLAAWPLASVSANGFDAFAGVQHIVVIYEENHSFDNLYGGWEGVNGRSAATAADTVQLSEGGVSYTCLLQNDVNLASPPQPVTCTDSTSGSTTINSNFTNAPFNIDTFIPPTATTCPAPGVFAAHGVANGSGQPGGCTEDIVHRFYQEQYQLNGGAQNRYVTGSDAVGLTMGYYDTRALPIYLYLHQDGHPHYAIADNFFQAAFGGSFLNHQWFVAATTPVWPNAVNDGSSIDLHSVVDVNGMPNNYPLYKSPSGTGVKDQQLTASCSPGPGRGPTPPGVVCGDFAVNTTQPFYQPYAPGTALAKRLPPQTAPTIGDRLSAASIDWAWYSGGWSNADGDVGAPGWTNGSTVGTCTNPNTASGATYPNCPDKLFQYHHQALNYFASFAPGTAARAQHLRDEAEFQSLAQGSDRQCNLKPVSFIKPIGEENEHPGYTNETAGSNHLVSLLSAIESGACAKNTMVVVTYDEFGGQWDHVTPPGQGGKAGVHDAFGPGTRIPALVITTHLRGDFVVDSTLYDTTSILATIEHRFGLAPLSTRDAAVNDLTGVYSAHEPDV
jgi:acid phosphatase